MAEILKDKQFFDYLLQSLVDHYEKLCGLRFVARRPEFTKEFFHLYWLQLIKIAKFVNVPHVNVKDKDDEREERKIHNEFDSICRSFFEVCESYIDLRFTTIFLFKGSQLADEEAIEECYKFMLALLFVSFWVADNNQGCPNVILKEPMARDVHACFNKYFKNSHRGNNEDFKDFIFDENKEHSALLPLFFSPKCSFNTSGLYCFNISQKVERSTRENTINASLLSETTEALMKAMKEEKLVTDNKHIQKTLNGETAELRGLATTYTVEKYKLEDVKEDLQEKFEKVTKLYGDIMEEKRGVQKDLIKAEHELATSNNLVMQKQAEIKNIFEQLQFLNDVNSKLQKECDSSKAEMSKAVAENARLNDSVKELEDEQRNLQEKLDARMAEFYDFNKLYGDIMEEKHGIHNDLMEVKNKLVDSNKQLQFLKTENKSFQIERDSCKTELTEIVAENDRLKNTVAARNFELEEVRKRSIYLAEEKKVVQQYLMAIKGELSNAKCQIVEKENVNKYIHRQLESSNGTVSELESKLRSLNVVSTDVADKEKLKELKKALNGTTEYEENLEIDKQVLQESLYLKTPQKTSSSATCELQKHFTFLPQNDGENGLSSSSDSENEERPPPKLPKPNSLKAPVIGLIQCLENHFIKTDKNFAEMNSEMNENFDKINERLNRVLGTGENDIASWLERKSKRHMEKHFTRDFKCNYKFKRSDSFEEELDLFSTRTENENAIMAEVTMSLIDERKLKLCVDKRARLAEHLNIQKEDIQAFIVTLRMDSNNKEMAHTNAPDTYDQKLTKKEI
uniref:Uncharacterized protein n=1 Tax=Panagrolaimus sp. ES5 TaxID=591445 RepID=A0AC34GNS2_9BILA